MSMTAFLDEYRAAIAAFIASPDESGRQRAYDLGRTAIAQGLGVLDVSRIHSLALDHDAQLAAAGMLPWEFFSEVLAPFEMALRGVRDANATLKRFNQNLEERVTERTRELRATEKQLREKTALLSSVLDSMEDGVAAISAQGDVTMANRRGEELFGQLDADRKARRITDVLTVFEPDETTPMPPADRPIVRALAGTAVREVDLFARSAGLPNGAHFTVSASPLRDESGRARGAVVVFRDTTARRRAEEAARKAEEKLTRAQKLDAVGQLAGGVAHDFNNLLAVILSCCNLLTDDMATDDPHVADILEIQRAATSAATLTRQLLAFSRQQVLMPVPLVLNDVVADVSKMLARTLGEQIDLATVLAPDLARVLADRGQVEQVLMNLALNARDAMPSGGKLTIETSNMVVDRTDAPDSLRSSVTEGPFVVLAVTDTGTGMDAETKARIFEPFFTTKERGRGTGLGLATVYGIVKQSGGHITVYSELGRGTTFRVFFPVTLASAPRATTEAARPSARGTETVLLVEDDDQVRAVAKRALSATGYFVLVANGIAEARTVSRSHRGEIHLLLTDVVMQDGAGPDLASELVLERPSMRVLFMSGYAASGVARHGTVPRDAAFLEKPFTADKLRERVRRLLDER